MKIRVSMVLCAIWTLIFSFPLMRTASDTVPKTTEKVGIIGSYKLLFASIARLWRKDRSLVYFLGSSALYRDGLAGVFSFGGVIAAKAFGFSDGEVLVFGIAANLVAGIATITFGYADDYFGSRPVILFSLTSMVTLGLLIFFLHDAGTIVFWICGLLLCVFVGPTQSSSRTYLARIIPAGEESEIFGLYATTGRAVSFLSPFLYSMAITIGATALDITKDEAAYFGILGIVVVLLAGFLTFFLIKPERKNRDNVAAFEE
ncbi:MFS transporter [Flaviflexus ciconiae]|uniref:MFS transporter n=1 Tax=Flaviflexus ciconiae TaxID=2496867 RepID=UPI001D1848F6|nr:MFS transporter [Flaviflexus ciconiae]